MAFTRCHWEDRQIPSNLNLSLLKVVLFIIKKDFAARNQFKNYNSRPFFSWKTAERILSCKDVIRDESPELPVVQVTVLIERYQIETFHYKTQLPMKCNTIKLRNFKNTSFQLFLSLCKKVWQSLKNENISFCINVNYFFHCMKSQSLYYFKNEQKKPDTTRVSWKKYNWTYDSPSLSGQL